MRIRLARMGALALVLTASSLAWCSDSTPVAALLTHERSWVSADGVQHHVRYQEKFYRDAQHVWLERVLPVGLSTPSAEQGHEDHHHVAFDVIPRFLSLGPKQVLQLQFVDQEHARLIQVSPRDYEAVGFDGSWDAARLLIQTEGPGWVSRQIQGETWRVYQGKQGQTRVLWDQARAFPRVIERKDQQGLATMKATVAWLPQPQRWPWQALPKMQIIDYTDTLD